MKLPFFLFLYVIADAVLNHIENGNLLIRWTIQSRNVCMDYLRMSNLRLTYRFKHRQLKNTPLKSLDLSLAMTNVFTIASGKLKGQDPTQANSTTINMSLRPAYTFALNVSF